MHVLSGETRHGETLLPENGLDWLTGSPMAWKRATTWKGWFAVRGLQEHI